MDGKWEDGDPQDEGRGSLSGPPSGKVRIVGAETAGAQASESNEETDREDSSGRFDDLGSPRRPWDPPPPSRLDEMTAPEEGIEVGGSTGADLPHWTEAPTGEVPAVLIRDDFPGSGGGEDSWSSIPGPAWREENADWVAHEETFENSVLAHDEGGLGSMNAPTREESQPWTFELPQSGQTPAVHSDFGVAEDAYGEGGFAGSELSGSRGHAAAEFEDHPTDPGRYGAGDRSPYGGDEGTPNATSAVPAVRGGAGARRTRLSGRADRFPQDDYPDPALDANEEAWSQADAGNRLEGGETTLLSGGRRLRPSRGRGAGGDRLTGGDPGLLSRATAPGGELALGPEAHAESALPGPGDVPLDPNRSRSAYGPTRAMPVRPSPRPRPGAGLRPPDLARDLEGERNLPVAIATGVALGLLAVLAFASGPAPSMVIVTVVVGLAAIEAFAAFRRAGYHPATLLGLVSTVSLMIASYDRGQAALLIVTGLLVVFTMLWQLARVEPGGDPVLSAASTVFIFAWVGVFGSFAALLVNPTIFPHRHGIAFLFGAVLTVVGYDVGALAIGRWMGRHPLAPEVSPHKTWEGFIGGAISALLVSIVVVHFIHPWTLGSAAALGLVVAVASPLGDLSESLIKRHLGLKDMGRILPGHGGVLDRIDGLLFVLPATYYLVRALHLG